MKIFFRAIKLMALFFALCHTHAFSQKVEHIGANWYERFRFGGYTQLRYNRLFETNENLECEQCDKSLGAGKGFFLRRARLKLDGNINEKMYAYIQVDMATSAGNSLQHMLSLKDAYFDLAIDDERKYRFRIGQSKLPYGFENMQSSSNRLTLDRNDALNSAVSNERDMGITFYYAPVKVRERLAMLTSGWNKGSGDFGMFAFGLVNGQGPGKIEKNDNLHAFTRLSYPFQLTNGQMIEAGIQAYKGKYSISLSDNNLSNTDLWKDERIAASFVYHPQPFGFQAEYNIGKGPEFNPATMKTELQSLKGGYAQLMYRIQTEHHNFTPFVKYQYYDGGKKFEIDARSYLVKDTEIGVEWQYKRYLEIVALYMISNRTFEDAIRPDYNVKGNTLRLQLQVNY